MDFLKNWKVKRKGENGRVGVYAYLQKKEGLSSRQPNLLLNLKSNTMKNTVQRYCFFLYPPNFMLKKYVIKHVFVVFDKCV